jgi:hypothetical protein
MIDRRIRRAAGFVGAGLASQLVAAFHWTPGTFILASTLGAPLVLIGCALFLWAVWRRMKETGAV